MSYRFTFETQELIESRLAALEAIEGHEHDGSFLSYSGVPAEGQVVVWNPALNEGAGGWEVSDPALSLEAGTTVNQMLVWNGASWEAGSFSLGVLPDAASVGAVITWDGSEWVIGAQSGLSYSGVPAEGQILLWNEALNEGAGGWQVSEALDASLPPGGSPGWLLFKNAENNWEAGPFSLGLLPTDHPAGILVFSGGGGPAITLEELEDLLNDINTALEEATTDVLSKTNLVESAKADVVAALGTKFDMDGAGITLSGDAWDDILPYFGVRMADGEYPSANAEFKIRATTQWYEENPFDYDENKFNDVENVAAFRQWYNEANFLKVRLIVTEEAPVLGGVGVGGNSTGFGGGPIGLAQYNVVGTGAGDWVKQLDVYVQASTPDNDGASLGSLVDAINAFTDYFEAGFQLGDGGEAIWPTLPEGAPISIETTLGSREWVNKLQVTENSVGPVDWAHYNDDARWGFNFHTVPMAMLDNQRPTIMIGEDLPSGDPNDGFPWSIYNSDLSGSFLSFIFRSGANNYKVKIVTGTPEEGVHFSYFGPPDIGVHQLTIRVVASDDDAVATTFVELMDKYSDPIYWESEEQFLAATDGDGNNQLITIYGSGAARFRPDSVANLGSKGDGYVYIYGQDWLRPSDYGIGTPNRDGIYEDVLKDLSAAMQTQLHDAHQLYLATQAKAALEEEKLALQNAIDAAGDGGGGGEGPSWHVMPQEVAILSLLQAMPQLQDAAFEGHILKIVSADEEGNLAWGVVPDSGGEALPEGSDGNILQWSGGAEGGWGSSSILGALPNGAMANQIIRWNGSDWVISNPTDGEGTPLPNGSKQGQVLVWESGVTQISLLMANTFANQYTQSIESKYLELETHFAGEELRPSGRFVTADLGEMRLRVNFPTEPAEGKYLKYRDAESLFFSDGSAQSFNRYGIKFEYADLPEAVTVTDGEWSYGLFQSNPSLLVQISNQEGVVATVQDVVEAINAHGSLISAENLNDGVFDPTTDAALAEGHPELVGIDVWPVATRSHLNFENQNAWFGSDPVGPYYVVDNYWNGGSKSSVAIKLLSQPQNGDKRPKLRFEQRDFNVIPAPDLNVELLKAADNTPDEDAVQIAWDANTNTVTLTLKSGVARFGTIYKAFDVKNHGDPENDIEADPAWDSFFASWRVVASVSTWTDTISFSGGAVDDDQLFENPDEDVIWSDDLWDQQWWGKTITPSDYPFGETARKSWDFDEISAYNDAWILYDQFSTHAEELSALGEGYSGWRFITPKKHSGTARWRPELGGWVVMSDDQLDGGTNGGGGGDGAHIHDGYASIGHNHDGYEIVGHSHDNYASIDHNHDGYASVGHSHDGYASVAHNHSYESLSDKPDLFGTKNDDGGWDIEWDSATMKGHIIPSENAQFDFGNAEYKIRHLFLSDNSMWVGDDHKIDSKSGQIRFRKRNRDTIPSGVVAMGGDADGALASSGLGSISELTLSNWLNYLSELNPDAVFNAGDVYSENDPGDWEHVLDAQAWETKTAEGDQEILVTTKPLTTADVNINGTLTVNGVVIHPGDGNGGDAGPSVDDWLAVLNASTDTSGMLLPIEHLGGDAWAVLNSTDLEKANTIASAEGWLVALPLVIEGVDTPIRHIVIDDDFIGESVDVTIPAGTFHQDAAEVTYTRQGLLALNLMGSNPGRRVKVTNNAKLVDAATGLRETETRIITVTCDGNIMGYPKIELDPGVTLEFVCIEAGRWVIA